MSNILKEAHDIVFERSQEKERQYGDFIECNRRIAEIAKVLCQKDITTEDIYKIQIAIKLGRESFNHKKDNLLDAAAYIGALDDFHDKFPVARKKDPELDLTSGDIPKQKRKYILCKNCKQQAYYQKNLTLVDLDEEMVVDFCCKPCLENYKTHSGHRFKEHENI